MKYLMLSFCLSLMLSSWEVKSSDVYYSLAASPLATMEAPAYSIVMEDEVMLVTDTDDPDDWTKVIKVYTIMGILVLETNACQSQQCQTNLSALSPGQYVVVLMTTKGNTYTQTVYVG